MSENLLDAAIMELISEERFYGELILNMRKEYTSRVPTMGVNITDTVNLFVNPDWYKLYKGKIADQVQFLKHECHHIMNNHFARDHDVEPELKPDKDKEIDFEAAFQRMLTADRLNVSQDMAIHEYLPDMPREIFVVDKDGKQVMEPEFVDDPKTGSKTKNPKFGKPMTTGICRVEDMQKHYQQLKKQGYDVPAIDNRQAFEYYYHLLKNPPKPPPGKGGQPPPGFGGSSFDDHSIWDEGNEDKEYVKEKIRQVVNKAVENSGGIGKLPGDIVQMVETLNHVAKNWKQDLRKFPTMCAEANIEPSRKKRNRRYGILYPGCRIGEAARIVCAFDSSGSMCDEQLEQIAAELCAMVKNDIELIVIEFDDGIQNVFKMDEPTLKLEVKGRGGTSFAPVFAHVKSPEFTQEYGPIDGMIFFTDGGNYDTEEVLKPKYPILWALNEGCSVSYDWGMKTEIPITRRKGNAA